MTWERVARVSRARAHDTLVALNRSKLDRRYLFQLALLHEDMHGEALLMSLQTLGCLSQSRCDALPRPSHGADNLVRREVELEGGELDMGSSPGPDFAFDNEKPVHRVTVTPSRSPQPSSAMPNMYSSLRPGIFPSALLDRRRMAMAHRGQDRGATLLAQRRLAVAGAPLRPVGASGADEPVIHVNAFEAEAYCRFVGKRLPTEAEWEYAARHGLTPGEDRYPWGNAAPAAGFGEPRTGHTDGPCTSVRWPAPIRLRGIRQMIGNVWEWTATAFNGYPGFQPDHYLEYSQPWFGDHRVLRGGSLCHPRTARAQPLSQLLHARSQRRVRGVQDSADAHSPTGAALLPARSYLHSCPPPRNTPSIQST